MEPKERLDFEARLELPNHALFVGASQSGKTRLCLHLLTHPDLFAPKPVRILFHYDQYQDSYLEAKSSLARVGIELLLFKGCSDISLESLVEIEGETILFVDDFSHETSTSFEFARIATNARHKRVSLWLAWHVYFCKHPASRVIVQNVRYNFFLPSPRLESQLRVLGTQLGMKDKLLWAFQKIQEEDSDYRYLLVDVGPRTPTVMRIRSGIHKAISFCYT